MSRNAVRSIHGVAAGVAFLAISLFWASTVVSTLFLSDAAVVIVKQAILWGMIVLIPAIALAGGSGFRLGGKSRAPVIAAKRRRIPFIAANGILVLLPAAFFLAGRAAEGRFDATFYAVEVLELAAGAVNIALMGLSVRDGLRMTRRFGRPAVRPA